ncbi:MAG: hypothetical protein DYG91_07445 [Chloroflexi bacterium CFX7]|nr:hypothetical protein [Chloroflexi bacterium CFX7]
MPPPKDAVAPLSTGGKEAYKVNLDEATRLATRHQDTYNGDFERYGDLYAEDYEGYRPGQGTSSGKAEMLALEQRATSACPDRKTKVLRVLAGEGAWFGMEELWEGTNTGGDEMFGSPGTKVAVYAFTLYEVKDGRFARAIVWTGRPQPGDGIRG